MDLSVQIGLLLALLCALASVLGFLYKHRGAVEAADVEWRRPVSTSLALFRSRWYTLGILVATVGWGLHVAALALAPISLVQSVIAGGLVLLTVCADRIFRHTVTRREWIGVGMTAAGLAFLAATLEGTAEGRHSSYVPGELALYVGLAAGAGILVAALAGGGNRRGELYAVSAGLLWGASDVSIKAASDGLDEGIVQVLLHPLAVTIAVASLIGLVVSARSLQVGRAVPVIATTSAAANVTTIASGPLVFAEPVPGDALGLVVRILAFALVIAAAALTPPPLVDEPQPA